MTSRQLDAINASLASRTVTGSIYDTSPMTKRHETPAQAFVVTTGSKRDGDYEIDQICGTEREARKEVKDLKAMGHDASVKAFASWSDAEDYADTVKGY